MYNVAVPKIDMFLKCQTKLCTSAIYVLMLLSVPIRMAFSFAYGYIWWATVAI